MTTLRRLISTALVALAIAVSGFTAFAASNTGVVQQFPTVAAIRAIPGGAAPSIQVAYLQANPSGSAGNVLAGQFVWNSASSLTDDGANVLKPSDVSGNGRWIRQTGSFGINHVGNGSNWTGDIMQQIQAVYEAAHTASATSVSIVVDPLPGGGCYQVTDASHVVTFAYKGLVPLLQGGAPGGASASYGACIDWVPHSGTMFTVDYASNNAGQTPPAGSAWLRDITLVNDGCGTTGGCVGYTSKAIVVGTTNFGDWDATYDRVMIQGFGTGYQNYATGGAGVGQTWLNCVFTSNLIPLTTKEANMYFFGGTFAGNNQIFVSTNDAVSQPDDYFFGTEFFTNGVQGTVLSPVDPTVYPWFDFRTAATPADMTFYGAHFEGFKKIFIAGNVNINIYGGLAEDAQTTGAALQYMFNSTNDQGFVHITGLKVFANETLNAVFHASNETVGEVGAVLTSTNITAIVDGTFSAAINQSPIRNFSATNDFFVIRNPLNVEKDFVISQNGSPASGAACTTGKIIWDSSFLYVCTSSGVWKRVGITGGY